MHPDIVKNSLLTWVSFLSMLLPTWANANDSGFKLGFSYAAGYSTPPIGPETDDTAKQRLTFNVKADLNEMFNLKGGTIFFQYQNHNGQSGFTQIGDIQQYDGLDDPEYNRIHMLWYEQILFEEKFRIKIGKVEPKSEFFAPLNATHQLGFSTERSPTIIAQGPPSLSVNAIYSPTDRFSVALGVYDAAFFGGFNENTFRFHNVFDDLEEVAIFAEGRYRFKNEDTHLKFGYWRIEGGAGETRFNTAIEDNTDGFYLVVDHNIGDTGIGVYGQYGYADQEYANLKHHLGAGFQWVQPFSSKRNDILGAGISFVEFSDRADSPFVKNAETAYEVFYKISPLPWLDLQADIQFIDNPGGLSVRDALVPTFRATLKN